MGLKVNKETQVYIQLAIKEAITAMLHIKDTATGNLFKKTEERLYAYPRLIENIERYKKNIDDIEVEGATRSSKDFIFRSSGGQRLTDEEIKIARIIVEERKMYRDQSEIDEITESLNSIATDTYFDVVKYKYFESKTDDEIGELVGCDARTVRRNKNRLVKNIAIKLYGADAL